MGDLWLKIKLWSKGIFFSLLLIYVLVFVANNSSTHVKLWVWFGKSPETSVLLLVLYTFLTGVVVTVLLMTTFKTIGQVRDLRHRSRTDRLDARDDGDASEGRDAAREGCAGGCAGDAGGPTSRHRTATNKRVLIRDPTHPASARYSTDETSHVQPFTEQPASVLGAPGTSLAEQILAMRESIHNAPLCGLMLFAVVLSDGCSSTRSSATPAPVPRIALQVRTSENSSEIVLEWSLSNSGTQAILLSDRIGISWSLESNGNRGDFFSGGESGVLPGWKLNKFTLLPPLTRAEKAKGVAPFR